MNFGQFFEGKAAAQLLSFATEPSHSHHTTPLHTHAGTSHRRLHFPVSIFSLLRAFVHLDHAHTLEAFDHYPRICQALFHPQFSFGFVNQEDLAFFLSLALDALTLTQKRRFSAP